VQGSTARGTRAAAPAGSIQVLGSVNKQGSPAVLGSTSKAGSPAVLGVVSLPRTGGGAGLPIGPSLPALLGLVLVVAGILTRSVLGRIR
jgi:hypothetical protein